MAFPVPAHLPRRPTPQDVSSQILSKIDAATNQSLNSSLATSWLVELEDTIQSTKERIHRRVHADLSEFQRQLASTKSVQLRLQTLTRNIDVLNDLVSNPETGIISVLLENLTRHAKLEQESEDAEAKYTALSLLQQCVTEFYSVKTLIESGELSDAVEACDKLEHLLGQIPSYLNEAHVMIDLKRQFSAAKARAGEQLSEAYSRGIIVSPKDLTLAAFVQVRQSNTVLSLSSILCSLSTTALSNHFTTLRRDLTTYFIDNLLKQPFSVSLSSPGEFQQQITLIPAPPNEEIRVTRLENLSSVLTFLRTHLFPSMPPAQMTLFARSLCKPVTTSILNNLLITFLPSSFDLLPPFLELAKHCVTFEEEFIVGMLGNERNDRQVEDWVNGVSGHYERERRLRILEKSRTIIMSHEAPTDTFLVEIDTVPESHPTVVPVQAEEEYNNDTKEDAWGFNDGVASGADTSLEVEEDGWGFDDDVIPDPESDPEPPSQTQGESPSPEVVSTEDEPDPSEAWGWNDDEDAPPSEETAWDDPWGDEPSTNSSPIDARPSPAPSITSPKTATRLEKAANKGKKPLNGSSSINYSPVSSQFSKKSPSPPPVISVHAPRTLDSHLSGKRPSRLTMNVPKESYSVSGRMKRIIGIVEDTLNEGRQFVVSKLIPVSEHSSMPGTVMLQTASSILDLHMALYPVKFATDLVSPERGMHFSNDCLFLSTEVERIEKGLGSHDMPTTEEQLSICRHRFKVLSDSWYHDVIQQQSRSIEDILTNGAQGFTYTGDQDRYDECEGTITQTLSEIRRLAQKFKGILAKSKYYTAIGMVADAALSKILQDVLALPDIPEMESHRLSELCRILNALEGLFVGDSDQPSFVVAYVPSWLKFSYLSELLEASMADITYLFEEGALVDFDVEELVRLVRALFADTTLRTNTINKILGGHPTPAS